MGLTPEFRVLANQLDITAVIVDRFISMSLTDETGITSDMLEIVLADNKPEAPIQKPKKGAELEVFLGYDGVTARMGMFACDEVEYSGWPGEMTIRARGAIFDKTPKGKANLQSQKVRSWPADTKLGDMVAKIAKEHGMEPAVSASLKSIKLPHIDQADESDLNLLVRVGKKYDAIVKPANGKLVVAKRGESKSVSGESLAAITLTPDDGITSFRVVETSRESSGTVVAYWHETKKSKRNEVKVGSGEPVTRLKAYYPRKDMAEAAAKAELAKRDRQKSTLSMTLLGRNDLAAECPLTLTGFRDGVDGQYIVTHVAHSLTKDGGYSCSLEAELPTESDSADKSGTQAASAPALPAPVKVEPPAPEPTKEQLNAEKQRRVDALTAQATEKNNQVLQLIKEGDAARAAGNEAQAQEIYGRAKVVNQESGVLIAEAKEIKATMA